MSSNITTTELEAHYAHRRELTQKLLSSISKIETGSFSRNSNPELDALAHSAELLEMVQLDASSPHHSLLHLILNVCWSKRSPVDSLRAIVKNLEQNGFAPENSSDKVEAIWTATQVFRKLQNEEERNCIISILDVLLRSWQQEPDSAVPRFTTDHLVAIITTCSSSNMSSSLSCILLCRKYGADPNYPSFGRSALHFLFTGLKIELWLRWILVESDPLVFDLDSTEFTFRHRNGEDPAPAIRSIREQSELELHDRPHSTAARLLRQIVDHLTLFHQRVSDPQAMEEESARVITWNIELHCLHTWIRATLEELPKFQVSWNLQEQFQKSRSGDPTLDRYNALLLEALQFHSDCLHLSENVWNDSSEHSLLGIILRSAVASAPFCDQLLEEPIFSNFIGCIERMPAGALLRAPRRDEYPTPDYCALNILIDLEPKSLGDSVYQLYDLLLRKVIEEHRMWKDRAAHAERDHADEDVEMKQEDALVPMDQAEEKLEGDLHPHRGEEQLLDVPFALSDWLQKFASGTDCWSPTSLDLVSSLLTHYGLLTDEYGHDLNYHILASLSLVRLEWRIMRTFHSDFLQPAPAPGGRNILQAALRLHAQSKQLHPESATELVQVVHSAVERWHSSFWPELQSILRDYLINDVARLVEEYLMPLPGLDANDPPIESKTERGGGRQDDLASRKG